MNLLRTPLFRLLDLELKTIRAVPTALNEVARMTGEAQTHRSITGATLLFSASMKHNSRSLGGLWRLLLAVGLLAVPAVLLGLLLMLARNQLGWFSERPDFREEADTGFFMEPAFIPLALVVITIWFALGMR